MKSKILYTISLFILFFSIHLKAQDLTVKQQEYEKNKVQIFTVKERDNLQYWIQDEFAKMNLTEEKEELYVNTLLTYLAKMKRLVDKDLAYSKDEILENLDDLIERQNREVKKILSKSEYKMHLKTYDRLLLSVKNRLAETEFE